MTRQHPQGVVEAALDWVVRDDEPAYAVRSFAVRGHCQQVPVEPEGGRHSGGRADPKIVAAHGHREGIA